MKLPELKQHVRNAWESVNSWKGELTSSPESYVTEIKRFGDRRYKKTWIKALAQLRAIRIYETCLDAWSLITISFNFTPDRWDYEYRHEILEAFLQYPDGLELIRTGLEQLFSSDFGPEEKEDVHGFYSLVEERAGQPGGISFPVEPDWAITGASTATSTS